MKNLDHHDDLRSKKNKEIENPMLRPARLNKVLLVSNQGELGCQINGCRMPDSRRKDKISDLVFTF